MSQSFYEGEDGSHLSADGGDRLENGGSRNSNRKSPIDLQAEENKRIRAFLVGKAESRSQWASSALAGGTSAGGDAVTATSPGGSPNAGLASLVRSTALASDTLASTSATPQFSHALAELRGLVDTLGLEIAGEHILTNIKPHPRYGIGTGVAENITAQASEAQADCIIFDFEISPTHQRNWEKLASVPVFDRHEVILRIFAQRARTKEAVLQVELAKLAYSLPRLAHTYGDMARQRGGSYGAKGAGETKLELDRRAVQEKMYRIKKELEKVQKDRKTNRKRRDKIPLPTCAIVGYTNAGKSSLLNALTGADVLVENKLFATLDPTTRRLPLGNGSAVLLTDTVGFIDGLPHNLVDAFKSTLEEAALADLLLIVLDASDPNIENQYKTVMKVLAEINANAVPSVILLNKTDLLTGSSFDGSVFTYPGLDNPDVAPKMSGNTILNRLNKIFPDSLSISVKAKIGFQELKSVISEKLLGSEEHYSIPLEKSYIVEEVRKSGQLISEKWETDFVKITTRTNIREKNILAPYLMSDNA